MCGMLLHAQSVEDRLGYDLYVRSTVVNLSLKFSRVKLVGKMFDRMPGLWNAVITGLVRNYYYGDSIEVFGNMIAEGMQWESMVGATVFPSAAEMQELRIGMGIWCLALKLGFHFTAYMKLGLISLYSKCGQFNTARSLFRQIIQTDLMVYNAMVSGFTCINEIRSSARIFREVLPFGNRVRTDQSDHGCSQESVKGCALRSTCAVFENALSTGEGIPNERILPIISVSFLEFEEVP